MDIQEIKKQLPTGAMKDLALTTGVHWATINRFFNGKKIKNDTELKIINATTTLIKTTKEQKANALQELQAVASA